MNTTEKVKALAEEKIKETLALRENLRNLTTQSRLTEVGLALFRMQAEAAKEIAQSYLELQKELERKTKALEEAKIDCEGTVTEAGTSFKETDLYDIICEALLNE